MEAPPSPAMLAQKQTQVELDMMETEGPDDVEDDTAGESAPSEAAMHPIDRIMEIGF